MHWLLGTGRIAQPTRRLCHLYGTTRAEAPMDKRVPHKLARPQVIVRDTERDQSSSPPGSRVSKSRPAATALYRAAHLTALVGMSIRGVAA